MTASVVISLFSALAWGISDFLGGVTAKRFASLPVTLLRESVQGLIYVVAIVFVVPSAFAMRDFGIGLGTGLVCGVGLPLFYGALAHGRMAVVAPVTGTVGALFPIAVGIASGERPGVWQFVGLIFAIVAVGLVSVERVEHESGVSIHRFPVADVVKATMCGVAFGTFFIGMHHASDASGAWPLFGVCVGIIAVLLPWMKLRPDAPKGSLRSKSFAGWCIAGAVTDVAAGVLYTVASRQGLLSVTAGVSSLYPVCTALLAWGFLKEHLTRFNAAGLVLCAGCLALVAQG